MKRRTATLTGTVHASILVKAQSERVFFDLYLPELSEEFTSILAVAAVMKNAPLHIASRPWQDNTAGHLALRWCRPGDVFLMQKVDLIETFEKDHLPCGLTHPGGAFWQGNVFQSAGGRLIPVSTSIPWHCRHVRGAYLDEINKARAVDTDYRVDIYLTYKKRQ